MKFSLLPDSAAEPPRSMRHPGRMRVALAMLVVVGCAPATTGPGATAPAAADRIPVTTSQSCPHGHSCHILEVVDMHTEATSEDKGFAELRARAAEVAADAVVGAEFEHGEAGEPSHLSGVLVRFGSEIPPHVDIGVVDIPSDPADRDKGLATMTARAREMGGDQVIDVVFEHGDGGAQGHLRGRVIRYAR